MIRKLQESDIDEVMNIWLNANVEAHNFVSPKYWQDNFETVKNLLLGAEAYVYENEDKRKTEGFIGLNSNYIAGIFVCKEARSLGIGKKLLNFVKEMKDKLSLDVYQKNERAVKFYQREGFRIQDEGVDEDTGEKEYAMVWKRDFVWPDGVN